MKLSAFQVDETKAEEGVWVDSGFEDFRIKVARAGNPKHRAASRRLAKPHLRRLQLKDDGALELAEKLALESYAECVFLDFENLLDDDDEQIPNSYEKRLELLAVPEIRALVEEAAGSIDNFREELVGNSPDS